MATGESQLVWLTADARGVITLRWIFSPLHPRILDEQERIAGVGSGIVYGLVELAKELRIRRIWGEATVHSAPFYERLLGLTPILDLFVIESREMAEIQNRQAKIARQRLAMSRKHALK